jgi:hypothetical protein
VTKTELRKRLARICDPRFRLFGAPVVWRKWSVATDGCAVILLKADIGIRRKLPAGAESLMRSYTRAKTPSNARRIAEREFRAWVRSTEHDVQYSDATPVSIARVLVNRRIVAHALSCVPSGDGDVRVWRLPSKTAKEAKYQGLVVDGEGWRIIVMPMVNALPVATFPPARRRAA